VAIVEKWNPHVRRADGGMGIRQDLFGFIDLLHICAVSKKITGIQCFGSDWSGHWRKVMGERRGIVMEWLGAGGHLEFWGWRKVKVKRGGKAMIWSPRVGEITLEDFGEGGMFE